MSHQAQMAFVQSVKDRFPQHFNYARVLEVGSLNVNGTVRVFFEGCNYTGVDCQSGAGVDVVCLGHEYDPPKKGFDTVISCECFEHDPHWELTAHNMLRLLRPGGLFVATWASPKRAEHGTPRSDGATYGPNPEYYHGISAGEFLVSVFESLTDYYVDEGNGGEDVYAWGVKKYSEE